MRASELLGLESCSPPVFRDSLANFSSASDTRNNLPGKVSLTPAPPGEVNAFRHYISTIPWDFQSFAPPISGRVIGNVADLRQFMDSSVVLAAWPVILAMVPTPGPGESHRGYDIVLRNEMSFGRWSRPDEVITRAMRQGRRCIFKPIVPIKSKGPGVLSSVKLINGVGISESDDLEAVTRQLRKYAIEGETSTVFAMDNTYALYLHFSDAKDENAAVEFAVATSGEDKDQFPTFTIRELFVFSAWRSFRDMNIGPRDYAGVTVRARELDYEDEIDYWSLNATKAGAEAHGEAHHSSRIGPSSGQLPSYCLVPYHPDVFANSIIKATDLAPERLTDSDHLSHPAAKRRAVREFFVLPGEVDFHHITVRMLAGKAGLIVELESEDGMMGRPMTPLPTTNLVVKFFGQEDSIPCMRECDAYHRLRSVQGSVLPFSYGLYSSKKNDWKGHILMLENIEGDTIGAIKGDLVDEPVEKLKELFLTAWKGLKRVHAMQICHNDIHEENIILSKEGSFVFIDWEISSYQDQYAYKMDEIALRRVFRNLGLSEASLKLWARDALSPGRSLA